MFPVLNNSNLSGERENDEPATEAHRIYSLFPPRVNLFNEDTILDTFEDTSWSPAPAYAFYGGCTEPRQCTEMS